MVGFGAEGLGCFIAEHAKVPNEGTKKNCTAVIKIKEGTMIDVSETVLEQHLGKTYPWKWTWKAKQIKHGVFVVDFPTLEKINEASIYEWVPLRGAQIWINIQKWTEDILASGKMAIVWIQAKKVPKELKNFHSLYELGSMLGYVLEVDMETLKRNGSVFFKVGVVDVDLVPPFTKISTPKLLIYHIPVKVVEIVETGWQRPEEELLLDFDSIDEAEDRVVDDRDPKRLKEANDSTKTPTKKIDENAVIQASVRTIKALEQRDRNLEEQDAMDALQYGGLNRSTAPSSRVNLEEELGNKEDDDDLLYDAVDGENTEDGGESTDANDVDEGITDSQESFQTRMDKVYPGINEKDGKMAAADEGGQRYSDRLAGKNPKDIPVLELAKNLAKNKNLDAKEGEGKRKGGAATGRKTTGANRG
ncbi:hypothetical protein ACQ4PT_005183 [Festuca glaucescens]